MKRYECIDQHRVRIGNDMIWVEVGDIIEVCLTEEAGDILIGYKVTNNVVMWKRVHVSVLRSFKEVL